MAITAVTATTIIARLKSLTGTVTVAECTFTYDSSVFHSLTAANSIVPTVLNDAAGTVSAQGDVIYMGNGGGVGGVVIETTAAGGTEATWTLQPGTQTIAMRNSLAGTVGVASVADAGAKQIFWIAH